MLRAYVIGFVLVVGTFSAILFGAPSAVAQVPPSITIVQPKVTTVSDLGFQIQVDVRDFILDQANYAGVNIPGHGHIHYTVDTNLAGATWLTVFNFGSLTDGARTIRAELRNNDHSALAPPVFQEIIVTAVPPSIAIVSPKVTALSTLGFQMRVTVNGFILDEANYAGTNVAGQGHIHYYVDTTLAGATTSTVFNFGSLTAGAHAIRAELRNNDHSPLVPAVFQEISVTAGAPSIAIRSPKVTTVSTLGFRIEVAVGGFILDEANYAGTNVAGQGHIHYTVDGALAAATTATAVDIGVLAAGPHVIRAELRNNDHSALSPPVFQEVTVTAGAAQIFLREPLANAQSSTLGFRVRVNVSNFVLDEVNYAGTNVAGQGHIHYTVDGALAAATTLSTVSLGPLTSGTHTIRAELRNNDHSPLTPAVLDEFTVTATAPSIQVSLSATSIRAGNDVVVSWTVVGFVLDAVGFGGAPEAGRGHVHVYVDGGTPSMSTGNALTISGLAEGSHTIRVALHNNDHSPVSPAVQTEAVVQVTPVPPAPAPMVEASVFFGTLIALLVVIATLAAVLVMRRRRGGPEGPMEKKTE